MSDIPDELLREILSRLPVAPLLRFRCVSKSWKDLIDSDEFIKHHLNHSRITNSNLNIVLSSEQLYSADFDLLNETNMTTFKHLSHPFDLTKILGSCNGLLVLYTYDGNVLWNPSVKRFHAISRTTSIEVLGYHKFFRYGFGYDVTSDDYKLIRFTYFYGMDEVSQVSEVMVYSLKSDSWRRIPDFPYDISSIKTYGVLANGALHWTVTEKVKSDSDNLLAAFDLATEEYRSVPLPRFARDDNITRLEVAVLGGCLSLMCYVNEDHVDLWVMKEYGVEESWSILLSFGFCDRLLTLWPLVYSKCGKKVLLLVDNAVLRWYDLDQKTIDVPMVELPGNGVYAMFTCLESLVLLNNRTCDYDLVKQGHK